VRGSFRIGAIFGIPITVNLTWFLLLAMVLTYLGTGGFGDRPAWLSWTAAILTALLFFASLVLHELGHSVVARYLDIPVRGITLFVLGAVAQTTRESRTAGHEFLLAIAGPVVSILVGGVFMVGWLLAHDLDPLLAGVFWWLWLMNILVGLFNLLPAYPMDGGRVLRSVLWALSGNRRRATHWAALAGRGFAMVLIAAGLVIALRLVELEGVSLFSGVQFILLGIFLNFAAGESDLHAGVLDSLSHSRAADVMIRDVPVARATTTTAEALAGPLAGYGPTRDWLLISADDHFAGLAPRAALEAVPEERRFHTYVGDLVLPRASIGSTRPEEGLDEVLQRMDTEQTPVVVVVDGGQVTGVLHRGLVLGAWQRRRRNGRG
jgi:Zn-dependent protease